MTTAADPLVVESRVETHRERFRFRTVPGVHSHDEFRGGELLAVEYLWDRDPGRLLCVEAGYGVVGTLLGPAADAVTMTESSARAADLCEHNATDNGVDADVRLVADLDRLDGRFDAAVYVPKPYTPLERGCQRIADAFAALPAGGDCYVAAKPRTGLSRYEQCLDALARHVDRVASHDGWTLLRATRPRELDHRTYAEPRRFTATVDGTTVTLVSAPGLFSAGSLDDGTRLLAETTDVSGADRVLDLCCGYGPLGTYAALDAGADVWLSDDDRLATRCAERTLDENDLTGTVETADGVDAVRDETFDCVLCNPPTHAGDAVLGELFDGVADVLATDGRLEFVRHRSLDLSHHLRPFRSVRTVAAGPEHVVRVATR